MGRLQLFEFEDQSWFPSFIRNYGTDFLQFLSNKTKMYKPIVPVLASLLKNAQTKQIVDLGSGGGGGILWLNEALQKEIPEIKILLTDFYPNVPAFEYTRSQAKNIEYLPESVDARQVPKHLQGVRTQFLSLHHFSPEDAKQILQNAVDTQSTIAIFEAQERSFSSIMAMLFSPLSVLMTTPFIRPFKWKRLLYTYLIPVVPFFVWWDGIVSSLRTYSVKEMNRLVKGLQKAETYHWDIRRIKNGPGVILYLVGTPILHEKD